MGQVKRRKGIQHENISAEEQHMLTKLAKEPGVWKLRVHAGADEKTEIAELALCSTCIRQCLESTGELSTAPRRAQHCSCFQAAPARGCPGPSWTQPTQTHLQDALRKGLSLLKSKMPQHLTYRKTGLLIFYIYIEKVERKWFLKSKHQGNRTSVSSYY